MSVFIICYESCEYHHGLHPSISKNTTTFYIHIFLLHIFHLICIKLYFYNYYMSSISY